MTSPDIATPTSVSAQPVSVVDRAERHARDVLRPGAVETDRIGVGSDHITDLAGLGLLNHLAPTEFGGAALGRDDDRRLHEVIAGACLNTWLVWAQHAPMVGRLAEASAAGRELPDIAGEILRGRVLVGAGVSDVRRFPDRFIQATRAPGGWKLSGTISWVSGWGLNSVLVVAAVERATQTVVVGLVPVDEHTRASDLDLVAVSGSATRRVTLDGVVLRDDHVIDTTPLNAYRTADVAIASDARPHHFGLADTVLDELDHEREPASRAVAERWRPRVERLRADAYGLADAAKAAGDPRHRLEERLAGKAAVGDLLATLTRALVVSRAGRGIVRDDTAQLHSRGALFLLVQGQTSAVRAAQLAELSR